MNKLFLIFLISLILLTGCAASPQQEETKPAGQLQIANPWKDYDTLADAENACGLTFPVPEDIPEGYAAASYRVMNGSLLEVTYKMGDSKITVRMQSAEDQDLSGVYENFTTTETFDQNGASVTKKLSEACAVYLIHKNGYSFSIYAADLISVPICDHILACIC